MKKITKNIVIIGLGIISYFYIATGLKEDYSFGYLIATIPVGCLLILIISILKKSMDNSKHETEKLSQEKNGMNNDSSTASRIQAIMYIIAFIIIIVFILGGIIGLLYFGIKQLF